ncbi:MAG: hypothetical protein KGI51_06520 [Rhodospirillales bacterium]|nr:hypothetical protein [Rhodospirillales bacterium]
MRSDLPGARFYAACFLIAAAMQLIASGGYTHVWQGGLVDPDSYMRLVRIAQGLKLGHLTNMVRRDDSGAPLLIEWSRLFDAAIVALAAPFAPVFGWHAALRWAGIATAPLAAGWLGAGLAFAAAPLAERRFLLAAPILAPLLPGIHGFETLGMIHYHIAMLAAAAVALGWTLRAANGGARAGIAAGLAAGIAFWVMPETMPFVLLGFVALGWAWFFRPLGRTLAAVGAALVVTTALGLWIDPPHGGIWVASLDRLSIVYVALALAVAAAGGWLAWLDRRALPAAWRRGLGAVGALLCFAVWLAFWPDVARGPFALLPADQLHLFFGGMTETQPPAGLGKAALVLGPGIAGLLIAAVFAWRARRDPLPAGVWTISSLGQALGVGLSARMIIFQMFPTGFAAALLPVALSRASAHFAARPQRAAAARIGLVGLVLALPYLIAIVALRAAEKKPPPHADPSCALRHIATLLAPAAGQVVLSDVNAVPELLYRTDIIGVGSLYQHGVDGFLRARAAWRAASAGPAPPAAFTATGARFVLFCPTWNSVPGIVAGAGSGSLWFLLRAGRIPPWLHLIGTQAASGYRLYRLVPARAASGAGLR